MDFDLDSKGFLKNHFTDRARTCRKILCAENVHSLDDWRKKMQEIKKKLIGTTKYEDQPSYKNMMQCKPRHDFLDNVFPSVNDCKKKSPTSRGTSAKKNSASKKMRRRRTARASKRPVRKAFSRPRRKGTRKTRTRGNKSFRRKFSRRKTSSGSKKSKAMRGNKTRGKSCSRRCTKGTRCNRKTGRCSAI